MFLETFRNNPNWLFQAAAPVDVEDEYNDDEIYVMSVDQMANITDAQAKCIRVSSVQKELQGNSIEFLDRFQDSYLQIKQENPQLAEWFKELERISQSVGEKVNKCKTVQDEKLQKYVIQSNRSGIFIHDSLDRKCLAIVRVIARIQLAKLIKSLPPVNAEFQSGFKMLILSVDFRINDQSLENSTQPFPSA